MAAKPKDKPKSNVKKTSTGKRTGLTGASRSGNPSTQIFESKPTLTAYEKEMGFKVVQSTRTKDGKSGTYWTVVATKPGQKKYMASGGTKRPKGRKGNAPGSRPGDAPGADPYSPKPPGSRRENIPGMPDWYPYP